MQQSELKFSDFVHLDRNDESKPQTVYFDVSPKRERLIREVIRQSYDYFDNSAVSESLGGKDGLIETKIVYEHITSEIEKLIGLMTIHELLCVTYFISKYDNYRQGFYEGMQAGVSQLGMTFHRN